MEWEQIIGIGIAVFAFLGIVSCVLILMYYYSKSNKSTVQTTQNLVQQNFDPNMTKAAANWRIPTIQAQTELLTHTNTQLSQLTLTINGEAEALVAQYRKNNAYTDYSLEVEKKLAEHATHLATEDNKRRVAEKASQLGVPIETLHQLVLEKAKVLLEHEAKKHDLELEIEKAERLKEIELRHEKEIAQLKSQMASIAHLLPQYLINDLHKQLSEVHGEHERVQLLAAGTYKDAELKRVEKHIKLLEKNIRDRSKNITP